MKYPDDYPPREVMETFFAMSTATGLDLETGELLAYFPDSGAPDGYRTAVVSCEHIDALVARGWVRLFNGDEIEATESGFYWLKKWCVERDREERRARRAG